MNQPNELENGMFTRPYALCAIGLLIVVVVATFVSWNIYPVFIDVYYHMGVIEGFSQAGGITTRAFWEMAPGGRVHIYPPSLHVIGYFFSLVGVSPRTYVTLISAFCYAGCLITTWIWLRRIIGERSALFALILLCGPYSFFWTQAVFNAVAGVMVLAPLAFLALETEHFLACGVINFIAITMHPIGLFLPPALVINTLLRRKKPTRISLQSVPLLGESQAVNGNSSKHCFCEGTDRRLVVAHSHATCPPSEKYGVIAGLLAASVPVALYGPWLAHIWANRAFLPDNRTGGEISLGNFGGGANLGLFFVPFALLSVVWLIKRRGPALGLVGALLGFAVVFPMGFGGRFLSLNVHWPLACLAGYGLGEMVRWLEQRNSLRIGTQIISFAVALAALVAYPAITFQGGGFMGGGPRGGPPGGPRGDSSGGGRLLEEIKSMASNWQVSIQAAALPKLFDAYSGGGNDPAMGPGPGMQDRRSNVQSQTGRSRNMGSGQDARQRRDTGPGRDRGRGQQMGRGGGGGPGMPGGMDIIHRKGAEDFFNAVKSNVRLGDVIHIDDPMGASLLVGVTGRWTSSGILRDVRSENNRTTPAQCDFKAVLSGGMGMGPGMGPRGGNMESADPPSGFEQVFKNDFGSLYRNTAKVEHSRVPLKPDVGLTLLVLIAIVGFLLVLIDLLPQIRQRDRFIAGIVGTVIVALCFLPLASTAIGELRNPPSVQRGRGGDGPGFGPPGGGFGGPGFGGPGFGGADFGPGRFLAQALLKEADTDKNKTVSRDEFRDLAGRWFKSCDADGNGNLELKEVAKGLEKFFDTPEDLDDPMSFRDGPPGFGPEEFLAERIFSACDANGDGKVTREEMIGAFDGWYSDWDQNKKGSLDADAIGKGLQSLLGPPPML
jgi:hypothetical protein